MKFFKSREEQITLQKNCSSFENFLLGFLQHVAFLIGCVLGLVLLGVICIIGKPCFDLFSVQIGNFIFVVLLVAFMGLGGVGGALFITYFFFWLRQNR